MATPLRGSAVPVAPILPLNRRQLLGLGGIAALSLVAGCANGEPAAGGERGAAIASGAEHSAEVSRTGHEDKLPTADEAWKRLEEGNARFVSGSLTHPHQDAARRSEVAPHQAPYAFVLGCIDSRVPVETVFDQGLGDLFVGRNAAAILDDTIIGNIEFAVTDPYKVPLVVIMGHTACGAVKATVDAVKANPTAPTAPGKILDIAQAIVPAVKATPANPDDKAFVDAVVTTNTRLVADQLVKQSKIVADAIGAGTLQVVASTYHLNSGRVERL
jgi:carbonic anhydrase